MWCTVRPTSPASPRRVEGTAAAYVRDDRMAGRARARKIAGGGPVQSGDRTVFALEEIGVQISSRRSIRRPTLREEIAPVRSRSPRLIERAIRALQAAHDGGSCIALKPRTSYSRERRQISTSAGAGLRRGTDLASRPPTDPGVDAAPSVYGAGTMLANRRAPKPINSGSAGVLRNVDLKAIRQRRDANDDARVLGRARSRRRSREIGRSSIAHQNSRSSLARQRI